MLLEYAVTFFNRNYRVFESLGVCLRKEDRLAYSLKVVALDGRNILGLRPSTSAHAISIWTERSMTD